MTSLPPNDSSARVRGFENEANCFGEIGRRPPRVYLPGVGPGSSSRRRYTLRPSRTLLSVELHDFPPQTNVTRDFS